MITAETQKRKAAERRVLDALVPAAFAIWGERNSATVRFSTDDNMSAFIDAVNSYLDFLSLEGK